MRQPRMIHLAGAAGLYTGTAILAGVLQLRLLLHFLPPSTAGVWMLFTSCGTYIGLFDLGICPTVGRQVSFLLALAHADRLPAIASLLRTVVAFSRFLAAGVAVLSIAAGLAVLSGARAREHGSAILFAWILFSVGAAANLLGTPAYAGLVGLGHVADEKIIRSAALLCGLALTTLFLWSGAGILGAAFAWTLQGFLGRLLAFWRLNHLLGRGLLRQAPLDWVSARMLSLPSVKLAGIQIASVAILQSANPIIALRIGAAAIPSYECVSRMAMALMTFALLFASGSTPLLSTAFAMDDLPRARWLLSRNVRLGMSMIIVPSAFVAAFGDQLVSAWLGPNVFPGFPTLWLLIAVVLLEVHHVIYASAVIATGNIVFVPAALLASALNLLLAFVLAPRFGLLGIALAVCIAQLTTNNWYAPYRAFRVFGLSLREYLCRIALPCLTLLALELAFAFTIRRFAPFPTRSLPGLAAALALCAASGCILCFWLSLDASERQALSGGVRETIVKA